MGGSQPAELPFEVGNFRRICSWMFNVAHYGWMVDSMTLQSQWEIDEFPHVLLLPSTYTYKHKKTYVAAGEDWHEEIKYRNFASSLRRFNSLSLSLSLSGEYAKEVKHLQMTLFSSIARHITAIPRERAQLIKKSCQRWRRRRRQYSP